jgi:hypothetical protein
VPVRPSAPPIAAPYARSRTSCEISCMVPTTARRMRGRPVYFAYSWSAQLIIT